MPTPNRKSNGLNRKNIFSKRYAVRRLNYTSAAVSLKQVDNYTFVGKSFRSFGPKEVYEHCDKDIDLEKEKRVKI